MSEICFQIYRIKQYQNKRWENRRGKSIMDNPETLATLGIKNTGRRQIIPKNKLGTTHINKRLSNTDTTKNRGWTQVLAKGKYNLVNESAMF